MIAVSNIISRIASILDAEDSDRFRFDQDYKPAINQSIGWTVAVLNKAMSDNKLTEESLSELTKVSVFQTNRFSRFAMRPGDIGHSVWTVLSVIPAPELYPDSPALTPQTAVEDSFFRGDLSHVKGTLGSAKRLTREEWDKNEKNPFLAGNTTLGLGGGLNQYGYLVRTDYQSTGYDTNGPEVEVRPSLSEGYVSVVYLRYPTQVALITDDIEFPESMTELICQKAANFISFKEGDQTNLYTVTAGDVSTLVKMMR
jgi:hypothetical protein